MRRLTNVDFGIDKCAKVLPALVATAVLSACGSSSGSPTDTSATTSTTATTTTAPTASSTTASQTSSASTGTSVASNEAPSAAATSTTDSSSVAASTLLNSASTSSSQTTSKAFPRIAVQAIAGSQYFPPANDQQLARYGFVLLGGNFNAWPLTAGRTRDALVTSLKNQTHSGRNAIQPLVFQYENANEMELLNPWFPEWTTAVQKNNWFLYQSGSSGSISESLWNSAYMLMDMAHAVGKDSSSGLYPYALLANLVYQRYYLGTGSAGAAMASTHLDGIMIDNMSQEDMTGSPADWERNGTDPGQTDPTATAAVTLGKADFPAQLANLNPDLIAGGNAAFGYALSSTSIGGLGMTASNLSGKLGMTMDQFLWGTAGSTVGGSGGVLGWGGFKTAMARYVIDEQNTKAGGIVVETGGVLATDYQLVRYSLGMVLMRDGWALYAIDPTGNDVVDPSNLAAYPVFDEFWGGSLNTAGYLGDAASTSQGAEQSAAWSQGVWRRDFANGIVLVNPANNGTQTVSLGGTFYHLHGSQAPNINNGAAVSSVTLAPGDGVILVRTAPP